jgi:hypothetical protein
MQWALGLVIASGTWELVFYHVCIARFIDLNGTERIGHVLVESVKHHFLV